jgi:YHS domain-containing protein
MYDFEDMTYYFCSELCRDRFIKEPEKYAKKKE